MATMRGRFVFFGHSFLFKSKEKASRNCKKRDSRINLKASNTTTPQSSGEHLRGIRSERRQRNDERNIDEKIAARAARTRNYNGNTNE